MSVAEIERFQSDIRTDSALAELVRENGYGLAAITETANAKGYEFELTELKAYISEQSSGALSDEQLAAVAGGLTSTNTWTYQSSFAVTANYTASQGTVVGAVVAVAIAVLT